MGQSKKGTESKKDGVKKPLIGGGIGAVIGFLAAAVLFSKYLPAWVPAFLAHNPVMFFGLFVVICAVLGYIWAITPASESTETRRHPPLFNVIFSGGFVGFLIAAVLYSKFLPTWVPVGFNTFPALFFLVSTVAGILVSLFWNRYTPD